MAEERESNKLRVKVDVDCEDALKGLKAITREAKNATDALKYLSEQKAIQSRELGGLKQIADKLWTIMLADIKKNGNSERSFELESACRGLYEIIELNKVNGL